MIRPRTDQDVIAELCAALHLEHGYAVECGARDGGRDSTTWRLRTLHHWTTLLLDAWPKAPLVHRAFLTAENIVDTFRRHAVPSTFDVLSLDVDGNDYWLWQALAPVYTPRLVCIEYNSRFGPDQSVTIPYQPDHRWDKTDYYGASAAALVALGRRHGYTLVDVRPRVNLFFAQDALVAAHGLPACAVPPADPFGYPSARGRRWETVPC